MKPGNVAEWTFATYSGSIIRMKNMIFFLSVLCMIWTPGTSFGSETTRINVVVIYTDDHRFSGIHALGDMPVYTPHMDQLVREGVTFTEAYLMGSFLGATCIPSRAMLLTGRNLFNLQGAGHVIPEDHVTLGEIFQQSGYHTRIIGKWHQDNASLLRSFDFGSRIMGRGAYLVDHFRMPYWDWDESAQYRNLDAYLLMYDEHGKEVKRPLLESDQQGPVGSEINGPHTSEVFASSAVNFIHTYQNEDPYLLYLAFHAPHDPRQAPEKFKALYPRDSIELTPSYAPQHPFDNGHLALRDEALAPWPRTRKVAAKELSDYYAIISHLDAQIGRVIAALKAKGQYDNTLIVLAGDSGLAVGNHGLMGKQNLYAEDGIHVPLVFSGGVVKEESGKRISTLCYIHDILPTICDFARIRTPASATGNSLYPIVRGKAAGNRDFTYHAYRQHQRAYRKGQFKLIEYVKAPDTDRDKIQFLSGSRVTQLFDLANDPWETHNLADLPGYAQLVDSMRISMKQAALDHGDNTKTTGQTFDFWEYYDAD